jgi:cysteine-rich repeat protein
MRKKHAWGVVVLAVLLPSPLFAAFHFMNIVQVFGGTEAAPSAQYVMLQMWSPGQNFVGGHEIVVFNGDGSTHATFTFPPPPGGDLPNGANQDTILIATAEAQAFFGVTADLTMTPVDPSGGAKICWAAGTDCVSLGGYTGSAVGSGTPFKMGDITGFALTRRLDICGAANVLDSCDDTDDSANDFIFAPPAPRNNARQNGTIPASTCGNNTLEGLEDCDDGGTTSGDGCSNVCREEPIVVATALQADPSVGSSSDGNGVFEPGETAAVRPSFRNPTVSAGELTGGATNFTGPGGATYSIVDGLADYGSIAPSATASCAGTGNCYSLKVSLPASRPDARPATHWDASFEEVLADGGRQPWTLHLGDSFTDVPRSYLFYRRVETVLHHGITAGCSTTQYCPNDKVRRDQMGLFLGRAIAEGGANIPVSGLVGSNPYNCVAGGVSLFGDVLPTDATCRAIHYIASQNVTGGCGGNLYCPAQNVNRAEMGIFVARGIEAPGGGAAVPLTYGPDPVTTRSYSCDPSSPNLHFTDISTSDSHCKHVHYLWAKGIVSGCMADEYCETGEVTRGEMARFLSTAFAPNLYEP